MFNTQGNTIISLIDFIESNFDIPTLEFLFQRKVDPNLRNSKGSTLLMIAIRTN
jgi:ankyrin repeat protein